MKLGVLGVVLPPVMVVFGVLTVFEFIRRDDGTGIPPQLLMAGDFIELALFFGLTTWGLLVRRHAASHKRLWSSRRIHRSTAPLASTAMKVDIRRDSMVLHIDRGRKCTRESCLL